MKKKVLSIGGIVLFLTAPLLVLAQKVTVDWGDAAKRKSFNAEATAIAGRDETGFYVICKKAATTRLADNSKIYLEKYDEKNHQVYNVELEVPSSDGKKCEFERAMVVNGKILLFSSYYNKNKDKNFAFLSTINPKNGKVNKGIKKIGEMSAKSKVKAGEFSIVLSPDSTKVLVYEDYPDKRREAETFGFNVIDLEGNSIYEDEAKMPFKEKDFEISNFLVSNEGNVFVLAKIQEGKKERKGGMPNYKYTILSYGDDHRKGTEYVVSLGDKFISEIMFQLNSKGNLLCSGFWSESNSISLRGIFTLTIDEESREVISKNVKEFDTKTLSMFMSEKKAKKGKELWGNYTMRKLIPTADGGSVLVAEQYWVVKVERQSSSTGPITITTYDYYYYYWDMLLVNLDKSGNIKWVTRVPKKQVSKNDFGYYSSFALHVYKDKIYLVYNDNKKNAAVTDAKKIKPMGSPKKAAAMMAVIDGNTGEYKKQALFNLKEKEAYLKPKLNLQTKSDEMVIYAKKNRTFMFGTLKFN